MYLGFTKNKVLMGFLLLGCIFASLALSQVSFESVYMEGLEDPDPTQAPTCKKPTIIKCKQPKITGKPSLDKYKKLPKQIAKFVKCTDKKIKMYDKFVKCSTTKSSEPT